MVKDGTLAMGYNPHNDCAVQMLWPREEYPITQRKYCLEEVHPFTRILQYLLGEAFDGEQIQSILSLFKYILSLWSSSISNPVELGTLFYLNLRKISPRLPDKVTS